MVFSVFQLLSVAVLIGTAQAAASSRLSTDDMIELLREWELDDVFESTFRAKKFNGNTLIGGTKKDFDDVFADVDALHRRALFDRIRGLTKHSRRLAAAKDSMVGYKGVQVRSDKSFFTLGTKADIKLYRASNGNLKIVAPTVEFLTAKVLVNGKLLVGGTGKSLDSRVAALEKGQKTVSVVDMAPCAPSSGIDSVRAWNTKIKHHDVDLTKAFQQFDTDAQVLRDGNGKTGFTISANIFWYIGVELSEKCAAATFTYALTSNLHHLRTAYSMDGKSWTCASNYIDYQGKAKAFSGCKGGSAAKYHGKTGTIKFTKAAKYYAFGFRDAGFVSELTMKCGNSIMTKAEHKYRRGDGKCAACPKGYGCNGRTACPPTKISDGGKCKACPAGYTCDGVNKRKCDASTGIDKVMAWNTGQKNHDVDLTKTFSQFTTNGMILRDDKPSTGFNIVSNIFWYIGVKLNKPCNSAIFKYSLTSNLHHLRTAVSMDGKSWDCVSDYTDYAGNNRKFTGCKGGSAASFHGKTQAIRFTKRAQYYAFGFRDAGMVSQIEMVCDGKVVGVPAARHVEGNKCKGCPSGYACDGKTKTKCGTKYVDGGKCKACPAGYTCTDGVRAPCSRTFGMASVMAWNTGQKNHDVALTKSFAQFTTPASVLVDNNGGTFLNIVSNIFWYIGVKTSKVCRNAVFNFKLTSNLHHLRTAYSQDGNKWTCASDYKDYANNNRKFTGCKGGSAASYHGKTQAIRFSKAAQYYAFGFRDAGKVSAITMTCEGKAVPLTTSGRYVDNNVCKACPAGYSCDGGKKMMLRIDRVMAWNTGQRHHDVALTKKFSQFTTSAAVFIDGNGGTGINIVSNIFWYIGVKLTASCSRAKFYFKLTSNLHHLRTAYSQNGNSWTCASDYKDYAGNNRAFTGCKGGSAASYHGKTGEIRFSKPALYYAFGFRDAGKVTSLTMTCEGKNVQKK